MAYYGVLRFVMENGAKGCEVIISGKLRAQRAKSMKFKDGQIKAATNNFSVSCKIGEGGFGPVYKLQSFGNAGYFPNGIAIAVKQLSFRSKQGNCEFTNEIGMIFALQHPCLVKLYGCFMEGDQMLLIYEYMENNNLASALWGNVSLLCIFEFGISFVNKLKCCIQNVYTDHLALLSNFGDNCNKDKEKTQLKLDWSTRRKICIGVAKGLAYLLGESRLKIVD
ncbi:hypothetical protein HN51_040783 [Arachis hypogaea]